MTRLRLNAAVDMTTLLFLALAVGGCAQQAPRLPVQDEVSEAEAEFDKAANRPPTLRTLYAVAKLYASQGKDAEAEAALTRVIAESPKFVPAYCDLAESQMRQRRPDDAAETLKYGLKVAPRDPILLNDLGMCYLLKNDYTNALTLFRQASALRPDDARFRSNSAVALGMLGRYDEALGVYSQVLSPADAHYNLGVICESRRDNERAAIEFRKSIELQAQARVTSDAARKTRALGALAAAEQANDARRRAPPAAPAEPRDVPARPTVPGATDVPAAPDEAEPEHVN